MLHALVFVLCLALLLSCACLCGSVRFSASRNFISRQLVATGASGNRLCLFAVLDRFLILSVSPHQEYASSSATSSGKNVDILPASPPISSSSSSSVSAGQGSSTQIGGKENSSFSGVPSSRLNGAAAYQKFTSSGAPSAGSVSLPTGGEATTPTPTTAAFQQEAAKVAALYHEKGSRPGGQGSYSAGIEQAMRGQVNRRGGAGQRSSPLNPLSNPTSMSAGVPQRGVHPLSRPRPSDYEPVLSSSTASATSASSSVSAPIVRPLNYAVPPRR